MAVRLHLDGDKLEMKVEDDAVTLHLTAEQMAELKPFFERNCLGLDVGFRVLKMVDDMGQTPTHSDPDDPRPMDVPDGDPTLNAVFSAIQLLGLELSAKIGEPVVIDADNFCVPVGVDGEDACIVFGDASLKGCIGETAQRARHVVVVMDTFGPTTAVCKRLHAIEAALKSLPLQPTLHVMRPFCPYELNLEAIRSEAARACVRLMQDETIVFEKKQPEPYRKAELELITRSAENMTRFLSRDYDDIRFGKFQLNKKGKLIGCRAYFSKKVTYAEKVGD